MTNFPLKSKILKLFNGKWGSAWGAGSGAYCMALKICRYSQFSSKNFHEELWKIIGYTFYVIESTAILFHPRPGQDKIPPARLQTQAFYKFCLMSPLSNSLNQIRWKKRKKFLLWCWCFFFKSKRRKMKVVLSCHFLMCLSRLGDIHKPRGQIFGHFLPLPPFENKFYYISLM